MSFNVYGTELSLDPKDCHHVSFEDIEPTKYEYDTKLKVLNAKVEKSSSILVIPFDKIQKIKNVSFEWKVKGQLPPVDLEKLKKKEGDDAVLRIGLLVHGDPPMFSFTAPAWLKKVSNILKHPSDKLLYLVAGLNKQGLVWESPYSDTIEQISVKTESLKENWNASSHSFNKPMQVVGIWIIVDGDDTKVKFQTAIKNLKIN